MGESDGEREREIREGKGFWGGEEIGLSKRPKGDREKEEGATPRRRTLVWASKKGVCLGGRLVLPSAPQKPPPTQAKKVGLLGIRVWLRAPPRARSLLPSKGGRKGRGEEARGSGGVEEGGRVSVGVWHVQWVAGGGLYRRAS